MTTLTCANCGILKEDFEASVEPCVTIESDAGNPFGGIPVYGSHLWVEVTV